MEEEIVKRARKQPVEGDHNEVVIDIQQVKKSFGSKDVLKDITLQLKRGENIVVHCRGGRGRSGLLAARLLVEMGVDPEAAILQVRAANPLAIETPVQEAHIRGLIR